MKRAALALLVLTAVLVLPAPSFCDILEVADDDGNVTHYKYTDKNGSLVFTDALAKIPAEYLKKNKIVRVGPPRKKEAPSAPKPAQPAAAPETPAAESAPAPPLFQVKPEAAPAQEESSGRYLWLAGILAVGVAGYVVYRRAIGSGQPAPRRQGNDRPGGNRTATHPADPQREHRRPLEEPGQQGDFERSQPKEKSKETDLALKDYRHAAELAEKAGDDLKAAELFAAAFQREDHDSRAASGNDNALRSGRLFEKAGDADRAVGIYLRANLFSEAAAIFEGQGQFLQAAEHHLKAGNAEKAAECFEKGGAPAKASATLATLFYDRGLVAEAAAYSEKAGDLMQAATMYQEARDFAKAGGLFFQAGFFSEAAENFSLVNDPASAAEAYEKAGSYLQAAQAFESVGAGTERLATLYEKGGDYFAAGRLFVKLGQLDRALHALQQIDPASPASAPAALLVGMIFLKRGLTDLAFEKFLKIIDNQPVGKSNLEPYYLLALCYERSGDADNAKSIFAKILAEDYNYRDVRKRVARK